MKSRAQDKAATPELPTAEGRVGSPQETVFSRKRRSQRHLGTGMGLVKKEGTM